MRRSASVAETETIPRPPTPDDVERAAAAIAPTLAPTPLLSSRTLGARLKCELFQRTGSFKARGALNRVAHLTDRERARGVITISAGNHAQAVAFAAAAAGTDALVVMWRWRVGARAPCGSWHGG